MKKNYIDVRLYSERPLESIVAAIIDASQVPGVTTSASFLRTYMKLWPFVAKGWYTPPRNFSNLGKRATADVMTAVSLVEIAHALGVNLAVYLHEFRSPIKIEGGDLKAFILDPQGYILEAQDEIEEKVLRALMEREPIDENILRPPVEKRK